MVKYSEQQLRKAIAQSSSVRQALQILHLAPKGGNYNSFHRVVAKYNIDTSHFTGQGHAKGKTLAVKTPTEEYLTNSKSIGSYRLKQRLLKDSLFESTCSSCRQSVWLNRPIPLELDHIDGNPSNNLFENLRLLCPNCHAFTSNYRGKNKGKNIKSGGG